MLFITLTVKFENQVHCLDEVTHMRQIIMYSYGCMFHPFLDHSLDSTSIGQGLVTPRDNSSSEAVRCVKMSAFPFHEKVRGKEE